MSDILEELVTKFTYDVDQAGLNKFLRNQDKINRNTKTMIGLNSTLSRVMRRIFFGAGAVLGINSLINTYRGLDLIRRSIEGLTKSTEDWNYIQKEALRTGTDIEAVAKGYRNFYSAASMAGFDKSGIQEMYSDVLTASRAIGATQQQVSGALLALEQMLSKGKVSMEELRRQLGNALPGAFEIGAKAMGVTTQKFNEMVKDGLASAEFVPKFTKELLNTYQEAFPEAIKSLDFAMVNLSTSWKLFQYEIMKGSAGQELAKTLNIITEFLQSPAAVSVAQGIGKALQLVVKALGFIVKHWKMILFVWGVNTLMQGVVSLSALRYRILDIATTMNNGLAPAMNNIVVALANMIFYGGGLKNVIKAIGTALIPLGRSMLWITAIAAALYGIYLVLEDIFTYINHPEAQSFTKDLAEKLPIIDEMIAYIKTTFDEMRPILADLQQIWDEIGREFLILLKENLPLFKVALQISIVQALILATVLSTILKILIKISEGWSNMIGKVREFAKLHPILSKAMGFAPMGLGVAYRGMTLGVNSNQPSPMTNGSYLSSLGMTDYASSIAGGYNLNKVVTDNKTITNSIQINAQNKSEAEIMAMFTKILSGELDNTKALLGGTY